jgi:polar amino acid transport system substrate-binding protein
MNFRRKFAKLAILSTAFALMNPTAAHAETVLEKVARTNILTVGINFDAVPYSYIDDQGDLVGYSIDVLDRIEAQIEAEIGKDIVVQRVESVGLAQRIPMITSGQIDLACDTQFTWERDRHVDFSISYGLSGIRLITRADSTLGSVESLANQTIAVLANSLGEDVIQLAQPQARLVVVDSPAAAFDALDAQRVDAIAGDTLVLGGFAAQRGADAYRMAPETPLERYGVACMVPENNSALLNMVNYAIADLLQDYVSGDRTATDLINQWFGSNGVVPLPPDLVQNFFEMVLMQRAQVPPTNP